MIIHQKTRPIVSKIALPTPIQKYYENIDWDVDLSNNTNPYLGEYADYPDVRQEQLKNLYIQTILSINRPSFFSEIEAQLMTSDQLIFTAGSMEGLDLLLRTFTDPLHDKICLGAPTFSAYEHWGLIHGLTIKNIPFTGPNLEFLDIDKIRQIDPKLVFLCNPNNPTGTMLTPQLIENLCDTIDGFVIVDEAYIEFSAEPSFLFKLNKHKNLIILRTLSKAWGLAGIRCGAIFADPLIINAIRRVQLPFSLSTFSQYKVEERLLSPENTFSSWVWIKHSREKLIQNLRNQSNIEKVYDSSTNFILVLLKNWEPTMDMLRKYRIYVLDCSHSIPNAIRVSLGTEGQNDLFLRAIKEAAMSRYP